MEAFFVSTAIVALAEMGDKTQLLALVLAARFRKPWPIVLGILVATLANHGLAGAVGAWVTTVVGPQELRWILGASFIAMAVWMLIPDKLDEGDADGTPRWGVFGTTLVAFFLAEMGRNHAGHDAGQCARGLAGRPHHAPGAHSHRSHCVGGDFRGPRPGGDFCASLMGQGRCRVALLVYLHDAPICHSLRALNKFC